MCGCRPARCACVHAWYVRVALQNYLLLLAMHAPCMGVAFVCRAPSTNSHRRGRCSPADPRPRQASRRRLPLPSSSSWRRTPTPPRIHALGTLYGSIIGVCRILYAYIAYLWLLSSGIGCGVKVLTEKSNSWLAIHRPPTGAGWHHHLHIAPGGAQDGEKDAGRRGTCGTERHA
jgi:hypothetical protein